MLVYVLLKFDSKMLKETVYIILILVCIVQSDMTEICFGKHSEGVIAAFGDFNSDELTDAFVIRNLSNIDVFLAFEKEPLLRPSQFSCHFNTSVITSIVPGDFDGDAYMDILITTQDQQDISTNTHAVRILWGGLDTLNCSDSSIKALSIGQPLVIDYNKDMVMDLFGVNMQYQRVFWVFDSSRSTPKEIYFSEDYYQEVKHPHSHSFIDVNDDNAADLLITTNNNIELWLSEETQDFRYNGSIELLVGHPAIYGQALFTDVALSGEFYLVTPVCYDPQCTNSSILIYDNKKWHDLHVDLNDGKGTDWRFVPPRNETYLDTITMRSGDYNMDGYPDILMTLCPINSNITKSFLLHNVPCTYSKCEFHRTLEVQWDKFNTIETNIVMATFFDLFMDGVLDIIYVEKNVTTQKYKMHAFKNELDYDTNFIKVIVVTGLTNERLPVVNNTWYKRKVNFGKKIFKLKPKYGAGRSEISATNKKISSNLKGTNLPGPRISYETWSQEGTYRTGVCAQLPQSAHFSLQLPYSIFGLDRTPNFVETLNVGLSGYSRSWTQIIPNSQILIVPAPPNDPSQWRVSLFVTPSKLILKSVSVLAALLMVILGIIFYLHWKERNDYQHIVEFDGKTYVNSS